MSVQSWTSPWQTWVLLFQQGGTAWCETSQWPFSGSQFLHLVFFMKLKGENKVFWLALYKCQEVEVASTLPTIIPSHLKEQKKPTLGQVDTWVRQIYFPPNHFLRIGLVLATWRCPRDIIKQSGEGEAVCCC